MSNSLPPYPRQTAPPPRRTRSFWWIFGLGAGIALAVVGLAVVGVCIYFVIALNSIGSNK